VSDLRQHLIAQIRAQGPMTLADYMATCLMHPEHGYYATRDPFGTAGDFTTAPEISQMFGELIGLYLAQCWLDQGAPAPFILAEAGPGRGTMMADILRATRAVQGFHSAMRLHLIEASPGLRQVQKQTLEPYDIQWQDNFDALPELPLYLVANEFFDALPIRQFQRDGGLWRERCVGVKEGRLSFGLAGPGAMAELMPRLADTKDGDIVEFCPQARAIAARTGGHIEARGGAALIIDYGDWRSLGDTFQAVQGHKSTDPLANPGRADLTAHVDFEALAMATPSGFGRLTPQAVFLQRLGLPQRAKALAAGLTGDALENHLTGYQRLTDSDEMGTLFKVMAFYPKAAAPPPGIDP